MDFQPPPASFLLNFLFRPRPQVPLLANATSVQVLIIGAVPHVSYGTWRQWRLDGLQYQVWPLEWRWRWKGSTRWSNADQRHQGEGKTCMEIFIFIIFLWFICMMCNLSSDSSGLEEYRDKHLDKGAGKKKSFYDPWSLVKAAKDSVCVVNMAFVVSAALLQNIQTGWKQDAAVFANFVNFGAFL